MNNKSREEKMPILYLRYKKMHPDETSMAAQELPVRLKKKTGMGVYGILANFFLTGILIALTCLSAVGVVTLINEDMRFMFENILRQHIF